VSSQKIRRPRAMLSSMSIDTDPQQQEAATPRMLVVRSFFALKIR